MSFCNLDNEKLEILVTGIKRSKSLLAVHLSGNSMNAGTKEMVIMSLTKAQPSKNTSLSVIF